MRQLVQPFSSSGGSCLPSITSHTGFATHHFTAVFCSRPNGNGPTGDKAVLSLCFKERGKKKQIPTAQQRRPTLETEREGI